MDTVYTVFFLIIYSYRWVYQLIAFLRCVVPVEARVSSIGLLCLPGGFDDFRHAVAAYLWGALGCRVMVWSS